MASKTITLSTVLETHKGPIKELVLNEPKARSWRRGEPIKLFKDGHLSFDNEVILGFLQDMTGHDSLVLDGLSGPDFLKARDVLLDMVKEQGADPLEV